MTSKAGAGARSVAQRLAEAEGIIEALLAGQIDAVVDTKSSTPLLVAKAQEKLRRSQQHLRDIIDGLGPGIFVGLLTPEGILIEVNKSPLEAAGLQPGDVLGKPFDETPWWSGSAEVRQQLREAIARAARGEPSRYDVRTHALNGEIIDIDFSIQPMRDESGKVVFLIPSASVITERKEMEDALRKSDADQRRISLQLEIERERLVEAQTVAKVGSWETDIPTGAVLWSQETHRIFETNSETFRPTHQAFLQAVHPEDRLRVDEAFALSATERGLQSIEHRLIMRDGRIKFVEERWHTLSDFAGLPLRAIGTCQDITESKITENALRQQAALLDIAREAIQVKDLDGRIIYWNKGAEKIYGWTAAEVMGTVPLEARFKDATRFDAAKRELLVKGEWEGEMIKRTKDGRDITVEERWTLVRDGQGQPKSILTINTDVTEKKKLESQLMVSDRMASVGTLAAGVAHEINNPLAAVMANLDYIAESIGHAVGANGDGSQTGARRIDAGAFEEIRGPLDDAREAAQRVRSIVRDLKIFSRAPSEDGPGPVDVKAVIESSLGMAWNEIRHRARLVKDYGNVPPVEANEGRLGQVFLNLLVNAAQAVPEGRAEHNVIRVKTRLDGERVITSISDTGPGISPEIIGRIFDAFFTTKAVGVGTGLGLAICQRIVTDMGGELTVESEVGKGATFRVSLPVARTEARSTVVAEPKVGLPGRRGRILVIDDEVMLITIVTRILAKDHDVVSTLVAKDALGLCASGEQFDLILCDLMMPDMTGMDLHRELSIVAPDQANRMIFLTGGAFTLKARTFLTDPPKEHIEKPFDAANLRAIVQRYLRSAA